MLCIGKYLNRSSHIVGYDAKFHSCKSDIQCGHLSQSHTHANTFSELYIVDKVN